MSGQQVQLVLFNYSDTSSLSVMSVFFEKAHETFTTTNYDLDPHRFTHYPASVIRQSQHPVL